MSNNAPIKKFRVGGVQAAIWQRDREVEGRTVTSFSVKIEKRYYDKQAGVFKESDTFFEKDLPQAVLVLQKAYEYAVLHEGSQ